MLRILKDLLLESPESFDYEKNTLLKLFTPKSHTASIFKPLAHQFYKSFYQ